MMRIKCAMSRNVPYKDAKGVLQLCTLQPGEHNYPMLNGSDPLLAEELRVLRKHHQVSFDELLPGDHKHLKSVPKGVDPVDHLAKQVLLKDSPVGKHVNNKPDARKAEEAKKAEEKTHARGANPKDAPAGGEAAKGADNSGKSGKVSGKG